MMKTRLFLTWVSAILVSGMAFSQSEVTQDLDSFVAETNAQCPIDYKEGWEVISLSTSGDTVFVEMETPSSLGMFLSSLTGNSIGVQRLWMKQLKFFGGACDTLASLVMENERPLVLFLTPKEGEETEIVTISPAVLKKE